MSYRNTLKLLASNFMLVWKQLLFLLICLIISIICCYSISLPLYQLIKDANIGDEIMEIFKNLFSVEATPIVDLVEITREIINIFISNFSSIWLNLIGIFVIGILLPYILFQMSSFNLSSIIEKKISMNMEVGYINNGFRNFVPALLYALSNIIFSLPFWALSALCISFFVAFAKSFITIIIGLVFISAIMIVLRTIKLSIFTYYTGLVVSQRTRTFVAFGKSIVYVGKNFGKIFSNSLILNLTIIVINGFVMLFTFFSGLIVTLPATYVTIAIFNVVVYFNLTNRRYYLGESLIYNPSDYVIKKEELVADVEVPETKQPQIQTIKIKRKYNKKKK